MPSPFQSSRAKLAQAEDHRKAIEPEIKDGLTAVRSDEGRRELFIQSWDPH